MANTAIQAGPELLRFTITIKFHACPKHVAWKHPESFNEANQ